MRNRSPLLLICGSIDVDADANSLWARLMRETLQSLQVHCGGEFSETQGAARRVSAIEAELIFREDKFAEVRANGGEPDAAELDLYGRLADRQRRLAEPLGWQRTPRDVTTLSQYLSTKYPTKQADPDNVTIKEPR